jgi:hypothetical protein
MSAWAALQATLEDGHAQVTSTNVQTRNTAKAIIFINMDGAPSHLDTFDLKDAPWYPDDLDIVRHASGLVMSRTLFPVLSRLTNEMLVLRSVQSWEAAHTRGQFYMLTGHAPNPAFAAETPAIGAVTALESNLPGKLPKFLALNGGAGQGATFLGGKYEPVPAPSNPGGFTTLTHPDYGNQGQQRFSEKYKLLTELEAPIRANPPDPSLANHLVFYDSAKQMMYDPAISAVFQFDTAESQRYGSTGFGNSCIVARNAIRANQGTAFITIRNPGWDTHQRMFDRTINLNMYTLCNTLDRGAGTLVEDLRASGHLDQTLIVMMGEFGRTPGPLNGRGGRDHHRDAMSVVLIGGGVKGGRTIGETDASGARVVTPGWSGSRPIFIEDLAATFYSALGINWTKRILDTPTGRIFEYVPGSNRGLYFPVNEVFG